jgi:hypothetical protein
MPAKTQYYKRNGYKWSIPETLRLQREFELLSLDIQEISRRHQRSPYAIAIRLVDEGFASETDNDVSQYVSCSYVDDDNNTLSISQSSYSESDSETVLDDDCSSVITTDSAREIATLKTQVSDINSKLDNILNMLRRSNGGSIIGMY